MLAVRRLGRGGAGQEVVDGAAGNFWCGAQNRGGLVRLGALGVGKGGEGVEGGEGGGGPTQPGKLSPSCFN